MNCSDEEADRILDKAEYVQEAVTVLASKRSLDEATYKRDREERAIVEREFQTAIEACIDIAGILVAAADEPMPDTYAERFDVLERHDVLSSETTARMRRAVAFRNVLAHQYGADIDDTAVYQHLQSELDVFEQYLSEIRPVLE